MNSVDYFALTQPDQPSCVNQDFRRCGNVTMDPSSFTAALRRVMQHVEGDAATSALHELDWSSDEVRRSWSLPRAQPPTLECVGRRLPLPRHRDTFGDAAEEAKRPLVECVMLWHVGKKHAKA